MDLSHFINSENLRDTKLLSDKFNLAYPFPHICIDNFLVESFAQSLHAGFPSEDDPGYKDFCREDGGKIGTNYSNNDVSQFTPPFMRLDALCKSQAFIDLLSQLTGIEGVVYDPDYMGGGIRESRSSTFLPPHLDFNYHPKTLFHRRLNVLLYLNKDWDLSWGGDIQVHVDPNKYREKSLVSSYPPIFNRLFIFETSEISWHGFNQLKIPQERSRRAWSIYYYTKDRPNAESIKLRNTEYVEPGLPPHLLAGHTLTQEDILELRDLLVRRDDRIKMLYEIRALTDDRYASLWSHYEFYLEKYRERGAKDS